VSAVRVDLNLIKVFDAVFEERNLLRAGKRLHISQSAVSHALTRLHDLVGEELFVRTPRGMVPTSRAAGIAQTLRDSLRRIETALGTEPFAPLQAERQFVVAANDHMTVVIVAHLSQLLQRQAPGIDLVIRPSTRVDLAEQIDIGGVDIAIGIFAQVPQRLSNFTLFEDGEVVLSRKGHPANRRKLTLQDLATYPLLAVAVGGLEEGAVDGYILERGLARQAEMFDRARLQEALASIEATPRFRMLVPHSLAIPELLRASDMLSIVPASLAGPLGRSGDVLAHRLPYERKPALVRAVWHARNDHDPAHAWLREQIAQVANALKAGPVRAKAGGQRRP
jgi:DNA-binding transcriptional LysR family regulator